MAAVGEKVELVEALLDRGAYNDGARVSKQPGRCCPTGCQIAELPGLDARPTPALSPAE